MQPHHKHEEMQNLNYHVVEQKIKAVTPSMDELFKQSDEMHLNYYVTEQIIKAGFPLNTKLEDLPEDVRLLVLEKRAEIEKYIQEAREAAVDSEDDIPELVPVENYVAPRDYRPLSDEERARLRKEIADGSASKLSDEDRTNFFKERLTSGATTIWCLDDEDRCGGRIFSDKPDTC